MCNLSLKTEKKKIMEAVSKKFISLLDNYKAC